jgi:hypothetical protein
MTSRQEPKLRLLVEGQDDLFAIAHLLEKRFAHGKSKVDAKKDTPGKLHIKPYGGVEDLLAAGAIEVAAKTYERLGIVLDANGNPLSRWKSVSDRLASVGVVLPSAPERGGTVVAGVDAGWRVGVWLMPDNASHGALEEFLLPLMPPGDVLWSVAQTSTAGAEAPDRRFGANDGLKARLRCWLAWQKDPGAGVGPALASGVLDAQHVAAEPFTKWCEGVFG